MSPVYSEMGKATRSLETVRNAKTYLPSFYNRGGQRDALVWCMHAVPTELLLSFGIECEWPENFVNRTLSRNNMDDELTLKSIQELHELVDQENAFLIHGHDPSQWEEIKEAPEFYY